MAELNSLQRYGIFTGSSILRRLCLRVTTKQILISDLYFRISELKWILFEKLRTYNFSQVIVKYIMFGAI